jgi:glycerol-3-phosphate acyltransferase PlsY
MLIRWAHAQGLAYIQGAIPTRPLVARLYGVDLTQYGSRRTGATNALRVLGKPAGALVLVGDALKGMLAVRLAGQLAGTESACPAAALTAIVGHTYSVFLGGRGGRGVATGLGGLLMLSPAALLIAAVGGIGTMALTRYVSLGSLVGAALGGAALAWQVARGRLPASYLVYALGGAGFLFYSHRDNIARLLAGTERRLGEREQVAAPDNADEVGRQPLTSPDEAGFSRSASDGGAGP